MNTMKALKVQAASTSSKFPKAPDSEMTAAITDHMRIAMNAIGTNNSLSSVLRDGLWGRLMYPLRCTCKG